MLENSNFKSIQNIDTMGILNSQFQMGQGYMFRALGHMDMFEISVLSWILRYFCVKGCSDLRHVYDSMWNVHI